MKTVPTVRVNQDIYYYPNALSTLPLAAKVVEVFGSVITIVVWEAHHWIEKSRVMHRNAPQLDANPMLASQFGVWDLMDPVIVQVSTAAPVSGSIGAMNVVEASPEAVTKEDERSGRRDKTQV